MNTKASAKFKIGDIFRITGRGIVIAGKIEEGSFQSGDFIELNINGEIKNRLIAGIDGFSRRPENEIIGILIRCENEAEELEIRAWKPDGFIAQIWKP